MLYKFIVIGAHFIPALKKRAENYRYWAEHGDAYAQWVLGNSYAGASPADNAEALKWYLVSARQGNANAQTALGDIYREGRGVEKNPAEAAAWYQKAAAQGRAPHSSQQYQLYQRKGTRRYFRRLDRIASAQITLSDMYETGEGVAPDLVKAFMWRALAAAWWKDDYNEMGELLAKMTKEQVTEATNQTFEWRSQRKELLPNQMFIFLTAIGALLIWYFGVSVDEFIKDVGGGTRPYLVTDQRAWIEQHPFDCFAIACVAYSLSVKFPRSRKIINWLAILCIVFEAFGLLANIFGPQYDT